MCLPSSICNLIQRVSLFQERPVSVRLHIVMVLTDHTTVSGAGVTVVVTGAEAETFLGVGAGSWSLETGLPAASLARLEKMEGGIVELGVEVLAESKVLLVLNTVVTC